MSQQIHCSSVMNATRLMLFAEIIVVSCENLKYQVRPFCGQNSELLYVAPAVGVRLSPLYLGRKCIHYIRSRS
jgi:hypothetical protein